MFTENVSISKEAVNDATATIHDIDYSANGKVTSITMQLTESDVKMKLKRQTFQQRYTYEAYCYKDSFPIVLAYAITSDKLQGTTIASNVLVDIWNAFSPGLTYVMLSRVTNCKNLKIRRILCPTNFTPCISLIE
jgi:hypothetical protein